MDVITECNEAPQTTMVIAYVVSRTPERYCLALSAEHQLNEMDNSEAAFQSFWDREGDTFQPRYNWTHSPRVPGPADRIMLQFKGGDQLMFRQYEHAQRLLRGLHLLELPKGPVPSRHLYTTPPDRLQAIKDPSPIQYLYGVLGCTSVWWP